MWIHLISIQLQSADGAFSERKRKRKVNNRTTESGNVITPMKDMVICLREHAINTF